MLRWRLLLGAVFITGLAALIWYDRLLLPGGVLLFPLALLVTPMAAGEMLRLTTVREQRPLPWAVYGGSLLVVLACGIPHLWPNYPADCPLGILGWPALALALAVLLAIAGEILRYHQPQGVVINLGLAVLGIFYVGFLLSFIVQLRFVDRETWSVVPLVSMLVVVKLGDVGAYTVGRLMGRHKLAPRLSPGKTVEGLLGGLAFACAGSWLVFYALAPLLVTTASVPVRPWWAVSLYGVVLGATGVLGDLAESLLKRDAGYKDSSAWLPGFGGVLDLLDSLLLSAPVAYLLWTIGLFGPV